MRRFASGGMFFGVHRDGPSPLGSNSPMSKGGQQTHETQGIEGVAVQVLFL